MRREREAEEKARHAEAAKKAAANWQAAQPAAADHAYLIHKGIKAHGARRTAAQGGAADPDSRRQRTAQPAIYRDGW